MKHGKTIVLVVAGILLTGAAASVMAQAPPSIPSYYTQLQFNLTSPTAQPTTIGGYANPAVYGLMGGGEGRFAWTDLNNQFRNVKEYGIFLGGTHLGFGMTRSRVPLPDGRQPGVNDWRISLSGGTRDATGGFAFGWSSGEDGAANRSALVQFGAAHRYGRFVSSGLTWSFAFKDAFNQWLVDLAVRPLGTPLLTVWADLEYPKYTSLENAPWSAGARVEVTPGIDLYGRYYARESNWRYMFGADVSFGALAIAGAPRYDSDGNATNTTWEVRIGYPEWNWIDKYAATNNRYVTMNMNGPLNYRTFSFWDDALQLSEVLHNIEAAKHDKTVAGVAMNLSGARMSRGKAWEVREALKDLQASGKHVVIYAQNMGMTEYHLASVADRVVMDPLAVIYIPGYVMGRTFIKDMLVKMGIGFDEWRFFKYKSAAEALSRTNMSEADKEQRLAIIEDLYATVRGDASGSRKVDGATFDKWVNEDVFLQANKAKELGLVDDIGRWEDVKKVIKDLEGERKTYIPPHRIQENYYPSQLWGEDPKIAVVYALGVCAMDTGINARRLERIFLALRDARSIDAVVFRVDSPGGDGMASDVVTQALRKCAEKKPVIVSQGDVAASGGYWISMYGTKIYALPGTITGSIGVIGGWVWDDGLGEKIGHTSDHVKVGDNADLGYGIRLLLGGPMLPERPMTDKENERIKKEMLDFYDGFVGQVAEGRDMPKADVQKVAQGRVWSGIDGKKVGLVDEIGGLQAAIAAAREAAGIDPDEQVSIVELPKYPWFDFGRYDANPLGALARWFGSDDEPDEEFDPEKLEWLYVRALMDAPGLPLYMLPPEDYVHETRIER